MLFDKIVNAMDERIITVQKVKEGKLKGKKLVCYGIGIRAQVITDFLKKYDVIVDAYCVDTLFWKNECKEFLGRPVYKVEDIDFMDENILILIGFQNYKRAKEILEENTNCYYIDDPYDFFHLSYDYFLENYSGFSYTYEKLSDELSRKVMEAFINTRITGNPEEIYLLRSGEDCLYDYGLLNLDDEEIFIDCGAYDGDSIKSFIQAVDGKYDEIYAFEPDEENCEKLKNNLQGENICCIQKGAWNEETVLSFTSGNTTASSFNEYDGNMTDLIEKNGAYVEVPVTTIDNVLNGKKVSFIKMDIEGSELNALKGASLSIKKWKPKMAICVYHRVDDLLTIPQFICSLFENDEYDFYLRHHSVSLAETVLYAIPKRG